MWSSYRLVHGYHQWYWYKRKMGHISSMLTTGNWTWSHVKFLTNRWHPGCTGGSQWFSTLDLLWGYSQLEVNDKDQDKTEFSTRDGLYKFKVMHFGLCNVPATFQRLVLSANDVVYIDDIVTMGWKFVQHLAKLKLVMDRLKGMALKLKPSKFSLFRKEVLFLDHRVTREGGATDPSMTAAVPVPQMTQEFQGFLGLVGYYR